MLDLNSLISIDPQKSPFNLLNALKQALVINGVDGGDSISDDELTTLISNNFLDPTPNRIKLELQGSMRRALSA